MIKWKQRLYAVLLRQVVGPLLDSESQEKLHESIDFSFQEGTFSLVNVALSTNYLNNKMDLGPLYIKKARVGSLAIRLSLVEGQAPENASSLAWRAMNLGTSVSLVAHIKIDGLQLVVEPLQNRKRTCAAAVETTSAEDEYEPSTATAKGTFSSYVDDALKSLQLTLDMTNFSIRFCQPNSSQSNTHWIELCLSSLACQDMDSSDPPTSSSSQNSHIILQKSVVWRGVTVAAGETLEIEEPCDDANLVTTIALAEGTGQVLLHAVEYKPRESSTTRKHRVRQDVDVRLHQHVKVSLDETSLLHLLSVLEGFRRANEQDDNDNDSQPEELGSLVSAAEAGDSPNVGTNGMELYTINGIMKKYEEARILAARKEMRGGILVPVNAFEEGAGRDGDSQTFDMFFDANDKSFTNYASVMKESILAYREGGPSDNFVHTKIRVHVLGGAIKLLFRKRTGEAAPSVGPEEYILLSMDELNATSSMSYSRSEFSFHILHLVIDDAHIPLDTPEKRKTKIGTLLCFSQVSRQLDHSNCRPEGSSHTCVVFLL
jgi:hypothetical protein